MVEYRADLKVQQMQQQLVGRGADGRIVPAGGWGGYPSMHDYLLRDAPAVPSPQEVPLSDLPCIDSPETIHEKVEWN